ncbi:hypothetical protein J1N35_023083, partial [Gossypium stocksii]
QLLISKANANGLRYEEAHQKELIDKKAELVRVNEQQRKIKEENEVILKQNKDLMECLAIVETKAKRLEHEVATEREKTYRIICECQDEVEGTIREHLQVFEDFKKKITKNVLSSILKLKMNILFHAQRGSLDFYIEEDPSTDEDMVLSTTNNDVTPSDDVRRGVYGDYML